MYVELHVVVYTSLEVACSLLLSGCGAPTAPENGRKGTDSQTGMHIKIQSGLENDHEELATSTSYRRRRQKGQAASVSSANTPLGTCRVTT